MQREQLPHVTLFFNLDEAIALECTTGLLTQDITLAESGQEAEPVLGTP